MLVLDNNFEIRAEKAYQDITKTLKEYNIRLDWSENEGILLFDNEKFQYVSIEKDLSHLVIEE